MSDDGLIRSWAPGRVNLIGDHTDYTGGLVLPVAMALGTTVEGRRGGDEVTLRSADEAEAAAVAIDVGDPADQTVAWARYVAGIVAEVRPREGFTGTVTTDLPIGAGLSSSAALEVALAHALTDVGADPVEVARLAQRAEQRATGVPCGIMDQLAAAVGRVGTALLIDCHDLTIETVEVPAGVDVTVLHSGEARRLEGSAYAERTRQCAVAEAVIGPLRTARVGDETAIGDTVVRARARHVITENARVRAAVDALRAADGPMLGALLRESHASLRDDYAVSTATLDALVTRLDNTPGVWGARLTGAGFGGCVVAVSEPGALDGWGPEQSWPVANQP